MWERARCHGGETNCCSSTCQDVSADSNCMEVCADSNCLDVCAECPPSAASKPHSKTRHWRFYQGARIPCGQCLGCRKNHQHDLDIAANLRRFFRPRWIWRLPLRRLLFSLRVINVHLCFITVCDIGDEVGVISGLFFEFPADRNRMGFLVVAQQSWQNLA